MALSTIHKEKEHRKVECCGFNVVYEESWEKYAAQDEIYARND